MPEFDFGHFHILGELGRGGMALVYKAVDTRTDETIALKILYPHLMSDENTIKRFQREAKVASSLKHKYIVPVVDYGEHDDQIYIAMRYMVGDSLADLFIEPRPVKMKGIIRILGEVASALDYAHQQGVIHRDLKLQNILLDEERHAYLSDFGIARLVDGTRLTATGQIAGTPMYMSPEQIRGKQVDFRSDVYSFSVMAYLMMTGYYPFTGDDSLSIIHKHVKEFPPTPTEVNADLPKAVDSVLLRGLMKDPQDRYDSTLAMVKALNKAVNKPEFIKTTTRIDIRASNPIDSVEMDAISPEVDAGIASPRGAVSQVVSPQGQASALESNLSSAIITGQSNNSRMGIFGLLFGILAIAAVVILMVILLLQNNGNNDAQVNIAQTQTRRELELELTSAAIDLALSDDNTDNETNIPKDTAEPPPPTSAPSATLTWTPTATITSTVIQMAGFPGSNAVILSPNGAVIQTAPGPIGDVITTLPNGTYVQIVGKTGLDDFWDVVTEDGISGFVGVTQVDTDLDINKVAITYSPEGGQPPNGPQGERPPNNGGG